MRPGAPADGDARRKRWQRSSRSCSSTTGPGQPAKEPETTAGSMTAALYPTRGKAGGGRGKAGPAVGRAGAGPMEREQYGDANLVTAGGAATGERSQRGWRRSWRRTSC
ncbi:hypothetical protein MUK42_07612 [Musa troglodytarum]|uniref:Uncharacterized protein n=1 Tax=Musa troglodytarum TaxID=320322 RepID=A0A9E7JYL6_9LILI|nr:hypothetical protein MUK42_07612 [Musa troglodytarum]